MRRGRAARLPLFLLLAIALASSGCASAGMSAVGPFLSVFQNITERSVERTLTGDLETAWTATVDTLTRMEVRISETDRDGEAWVLEGVGDAVTVYAELVPVTPQMTKISLRAEGGGLYADKETAEEILNQVALSLVPPSAVVVREPSPERDNVVEELAALEKEIRQLKVAIEEKEKDRVARQPQPGANGVTNPVVSDGSRVVRIPPSYGLPKLPAAADATDASSSSVRPEEQTAVVDDAPPKTDGGGQETLPTPLVRAEVLTPVPAARGSRHLLGMQP
ncbi:MAG: hypothetical protein ACE5MG_07490 [Candidatus Methylomirabilales bacterium]